MSPLELDTYALGVKQKLDSISQRDDDDAQGTLDLQSAYDSYLDGVKQEGREPFSYALQDQSDRDTRIRSLFAKDTAGTYQVAPLSSMVVNAGEDATAKKQMTANVAWLSQNLGIDPKAAAINYPMLRGAYGQAMTGNATMSDDQMFKHIAGKYELQEQLATEANNASLTPDKSPLDSFAGFIDKLRSNPAYDERNKSAMLAEFMDRKQALDTARLPYQDVIQQTATDLQNLYGATGGKKMAERTPEDITSLAQRMLDVPANDRAMVLRSISDKLAINGVDPKGPLQKLAEEFGRGAEHTGETMGGVLLHNAQRFSEFMTGTDSAEQASIQGDKPPGLTDYSRENAIFELQGQLRDIAENPQTGFDRVTSSNWLSKNAYATANALPFMAAAAVPYVGQLAAMESLSGDNYRQIVASEPGIDRDRAWAIANTAAVPQTLAFMLPSQFLFGKLPSVAGLINKTITKPGQMVGAFGMRMLEGTAGGVAAMDVQQVMPAFVHDLADALQTDSNGRINVDVFKRTTDQLSSTFSGKEQGDLVSSMAMLALLGSATGTWRQIKNSPMLLQTEPLMRPFLNSDEEASQVRALALKGDMDGASSLFNQLASGKIKDGMTLEKAHMEAMQTMQQHQVVQQAARDKMLALGGEVPQIGPTPDGSAWRLRFDNGEELTYPTHQEADAARWNWTWENYGLKPVEQLREIFAKSEQSLPPGKFWNRAFSLMPLDAGDKEGMAKEGLSDAADQLKRREQQSAALINGKGLDEEHATATAMVNAVSPSAEDAKAGMWILGTSKGEFGDGLSPIITKMFGGGDEVAPLTALEEDAEVSAKTILHKPGGAEWMLKSLREYEAVTGDKVLRTADDSSLESDDLVEAFSHLAVGAFAGTAVKGQSAAHPSMASREFRQNLRTIFAGLHINGPLSAMALKWQAAFRRGAALRQAMEAGKLKGGLPEAIAKAAGLSEEQAHKVSVGKEALSLASGVSGAKLGGGEAPGNKAPGSTLSVAAKPESEERGLPDGGAVSGGSLGIPAQSRPLAPHEPLRGLTGKRATIDIPGRGLVTFGPHQPAREVAAMYMKEAGLPYHPPETYVRVQPSRARNIADMFTAMKHEPTSDEVRASYTAMVKETLKQWEAIKATGLKVEPIERGSKDPYAATPRMAILDVTENNHLWFFPTRDGFGSGSEQDIVGNPLLDPVGEKINGHELVANDVFRIVHDYFGHIKEGVGFKADGEENAWRMHSAMYSELARKAMTTETRGQNSWVNFGPYEEHNAHATGADTIFAPQKIGLMPDWVVKDGAGDTTFSTGHRPIDEQLSHAFEAFEKSPDLRRKLGLEMQRRAVELGRKWQDASTMAEWTKQNIELLKESHGTALKQLQAERDFHTPWGDPKKWSDYQRETVDQAKADYKKKKAAMEKAQAMELQDVTERMTREGDKERLVSAIRTLDAIGAVVAHQIGSVGGMAKMAELSTDQARVEYIKDRVAKIDAKLEKHLRGEISEQLDKLLEDNKPEVSKGGVTKGKISPEGHRLFEEIEKLMPMDAAEVDKQRKEIFDALNTTDASDTAALSNLAERLQLLEGFGNFDEKSAQDMEASRQLAQDIRDHGRNEWVTQETARLEQNKALQGSIQKRAGKKGDTQELTDAKEKEKGLGGYLKGVAQRFRSFTEVAERTLGRNSEAAKRWHRMDLKAAAAKEGGIADSWRDFREFTNGIYGKDTGALERGRKLWALRKERSITVDKPEGRMVETVKIPIDKAQDILNGKLDFDTFGLTDGNRGALQAAVDEWATSKTAKGRPTQKKSVSIDVLRHAGNPTPTHLTSMEGVYITQLASQKRYASAMEAGGWTPDVVAEIEKALPPEAKALRAWMSQKYAEGYEPLNALHKNLYGIELGKEDNYAPARFQHDGMMVEPDAYGAGVLYEGGMNKGFLMGRREHSAKPELADALTNYFQHVAATEHFKAYAELSREMNGVLRSKDVKNSLTASLGSRVVDPLYDWSRAIDRGGMDARSFGKELDEAARHLSGAQAYLGLAWNIGTAAKHLLSVFSTAARMPMGEYARGFAKLATGQLEVSHVWNSPFIQDRLHGDWTPEQKAAMARSWETAPSRRKLFLDMGTNMLPFVDTVATTGGAAIAYDYAHRTAMKEPGMTPQFAHDIAMEFAQDSVYRTAYPSSMTNRSLAEIGSSPMGKLLWLFATPARQKAGLFLTAVHQVMAGEATKSELAGVLLVTHIIGGVVAQGIGSAWRAARDDNHDGFFNTNDWNPRDFLIAALAGPLEGLPLVRDLVSWAEDKPAGGAVSTATQGASGAWHLFKNMRGTLTPGEQAYKDRDSTAWYMQQAMEALNLAGIIMGNGTEAAGVAARVLNDARKGTKKVEQLTK